MIIISAGRQAAFRATTEPIVVDDLWQREYFSTGFIDERLDQRCPFTDRCPGEPLLVGH